MNYWDRDMEDDALTCTVSDLMTTFRQALLALVPIAERLKMDWRDDSQHRHWERMAEAVFDACVRGPIESDAAHSNDELAIPRYDVDDAWYPSCSWITIDRPNEVGPLVFVRLTSDHEPLDTVQTARLNPDTLIPIDRRLLPFDRSSFAFVRRFGTKPDAFVYEIRAIE